MAEFVSSFITGFGKIIAKSLPSILKGVKITNIYDGMIRYSYHGNPSDIKKVVFFNNSYFVIHFYQGKQIAFDRMVTDACLGKSRYMMMEGTFRIRFSKSNQFAKVDRRLSVKAENAVTKQTRLKIDRLNPTTELWYIIRNEGFGFYGQLLEKRVATEKNLHKGELRPELAYLMCCCCDWKENLNVMDPFAGFGAIPLQISKSFRFSQLIVNDMDESKVRKLQQLFPAKNTRVRVTCCDALNLTRVAGESVDTIITDPPWGFFDEIDDIVAFYENMLVEFKRVLKSSGSVVLLSARKREFIEAIEHSSCFQLGDTIDTLVNGKKAAIYLLRPLS